MAAELVSSSGGPAGGGAPGTGERQVRIFISSPYDAHFERMRVDRVVERLNGEFAGVARLETVRWEREFYKAHATFQAQIPEAADCDVVIGILRHRLGTDLPDEFPKMADGEPYPSGTAYEILTAMESGGRRGTPDLYVFRFPDPPTVKLDDVENNAQVSEQWQRLKGFFARWFLTPKGQFKASYHEFHTTDEFEAQVDGLLRKWLEDKILKGRPVVWPIETKGSPFRGLAAFGARHATVFFGRSRDIARSVDALKDAAQRGAPFLLVVGASGSGKSSLVKAGLVPRLTTPGVVASVDIWRTVLLRPGEGSEDPIAALAARLFDGPDAVEEDDKGRPFALPELRDGDHGTPERLAALLGHADEAAIAPIVAALDKAARAEGVASGHDRPLRADLLLVADQLDALFGPNVLDDARHRFTRLLSSLVATGRVWVVATLRADLYDRFLKDGWLLDLKTRGATYDLSPPGPAELAEIVRKPAAAADLFFDIEPGSGQGLDERLLLDADRPDMLPLLQFTLDQLFEWRKTVDGRMLLTFDAYNALGGLAGAVDRQAERSIESLGSAELERLPRLLRQLAEPGRDEGGLSIRAVPLSEAAHDPTAERLVDALVDARILLSFREGGTTVVKLAHQRVLENWTRAKDIVAANVGFYRIRGEVEDQRQRWQASGRKPDLLLAPGIPLAEAETILRGYADELSPETRGFIALSGRRARTRQRILAIAAAVFAVIAAVAVWQTIVAVNRQAEMVAERDRAEANFAAAKDAVGTLTFDVVQGLRGIAGIQVESVAAILDRVRVAMDRLTSASPNDPDLVYMRAAMMSEFAAAYFAQGDTAAALAAAAESVALARELVAADPADANRRRNLAIALHRQGSLMYTVGEIAASAAPGDEALAILQDLAAASPEDASLQADVLSVLDLVGSVYLQRGDLAAAAAVFELSVATGRGLLAARPDDDDSRRTLSVALNKLGDVRLAMDDAAGARVAYDEGLAIARELADRDPTNTLWLRDVAVHLTNLGDLTRAIGENDTALSRYEEALEINQRLARLDPANIELQRDATIALGGIGDVNLARGDFAAAIEAFEATLTISRDLAAVDPTNLSRQRDISVALDRLGDAYVAAGDLAGARAPYEEGLAIARTLAAAEPENATRQTDLIISLYKIAAVSEGDERVAAAEEGMAILADLEAAGRLAPGQVDWVGFFQTLLAPAAP
ncbi:MAG: tetratricopeptide repeat protein [Bauldia sp.]